MQFKVLTYNIHKGFSQFNRKFVLELLKESIVQTQADIVFLQEVMGENSKSNHIGNQFEFLADTVWSHYAYGKNAVYSSGHHGNAILSHYPIESFENIDLSTSRLEQRGLLHARVFVPDIGQPIDLFNTHLSLREVDRQTQFEKISRVFERIQQDNRPLIFAGDFNDWKRGFSQKLKSHHQLKEVFDELEGSYAKSFPSVFPLLRLDRIYYSGLQLNEAQCLKGSPWNRLSDHLALLAQFGF